ncbi:hypothetical protein AVEN_274338-1 [Araneus ventricosus]|nr:hypothetical protein AVEN_274338-1 [Araneus ventricosus]
MFEIFWSGYQTAFNSQTQKHLLVPLCVVLHSLSLHLLIMIAALSANEVSSKVKHFVQLMQLRNTSNEATLGLDMTESLIEEGSFTLWKIHLLTTAFIVLGHC